MGRKIELEPEEVDFLKQEIAYLIKKEKQELESLLQDRNRRMIPDERLNDEFVDNSKKILGRLNTLFCKLNTA